MSDAKVLDPCCGPRGWWFDKNCHVATYNDNRDCDIQWTGGLNQSNWVTRRIHPDNLMDARYMDYPDNTFDLVVLDPPHGTFRQTSFMAAEYGSLPDDWQPYVADIFSECFRVLRDHGTLVLKWSDCKASTVDVIRLSPYKPLVGTRNAKKSEQSRGTSWTIFIKDESLLSPVYVQHNLKVIDDE